MASRHNVGASPSALGPITDTNLCNTHSLPDHDAVRGACLHEKIRTRLPADLAEDDREILLEQMTAIVSAAQQGLANLVLDAAFETQATPPPIAPDCTALASPTAADRLTGVNYFCRLATTILAGAGFSLLRSSLLL